MVAAAANYALPFSNLQLVFMHASKWAQSVEMKVVVTFPLTIVLVAGIAKGKMVAHMLSMATSKERMLRF